jgi:chromosome segregation ATPase
MERLMASMTSNTETETLTEPAETAAIDWLSPLEEKVRAAAERIRALGQERRILEGRIGELEQQLAAQSATHADTADVGEQLAREQDENASLRRRIAELEERPAAASATGPEAAGWEEERREIRERVEKLTRELAELAEV